MNLYRKAIALFGLALPILAAALVIGICVMVKSKMVASYEEKKTSYTAYTAGQETSRKIEEEVIRQRIHMERWDEQLKQETASMVNDSVKKISGRLPPKEIQNTSFEPISAKGGFGSISAQDSSQIKLGFRGTYRTIQQMFLELETRMPQLQLQELKMDLSTNQAAQLNFQVTYTAWEN